LSETGDKRTSHFIIQCPLPLSLSMSISHLYCLFDVIICLHSISQQDQEYKALTVFDG